MEKSKSEQYTFTPDEKETLQKIATVEASVCEKIQNKRELITIKYYSEFVINTQNGPVTLNNVFITAERDKEGEMSYHFRWIIENENGEQTIEENLVIDENGKAYTIGGLKEYLGNAEIDIYELMSENDDIKKGRLKGISEKDEPKYLDQLMKKTKDEQKDSNEQTRGEKDDEAQEIEDDLIVQGQDLELTNIRKIKDPHVAERMPEVFGDSDEHAQAYSKKLNKYVMLEKKNTQTDSNKSQWQLNDRVEPAKITWKTIISIDEKGKKIERQVPYALMKTNRGDKEIAVLRGQYGEINIETVDVLPCQERIARGVREENEGLEKEEDAQLRREFQTEGKEYTHNLAHQVEEIEGQKNEVGIKEQEITEKDYIPNTQMTWGELMEDTGDSLPALVERYNREMAKEGSDSQKVVEAIQDDYRNVSHERNKM